MRAKEAQVQVNQIKKNSGMGIRGILNKKKMRVPMTQSRTVNHFALKSHKMDYSLGIRDRIGNKLINDMGGLQHIGTKCFRSHQFKQEIEKVHRIAIEAIHVYEELTEISFKLAECKGLAFSADGMLHKVGKK